MSDPVTNNFSLVQPTVGGDLNLWGGVLNNGVIAAIDATLGSNLSVAITTTDVTLTTAQFQNAIFVITGALTGNRSLILPLSPNSLTVAVGGRFVIANTTSGAFNLTVKTAASGSTGVTVPQGFTALLYSDGTNVGYSNSGLPAFAAAVNGNPNGQLAGTAGSVNTNASLAWDYTNGILYVCTTTGNAAGAVWTNPVSGSLPQPAMQGYLTPVSNTPIITGDSVGATAVYYTPFVGAWAAVHNGTAIIPYRFTQFQLTLSASQAANNIYDIFLAYNSGTPVIGTGPSWAAGSGGSVTAGSCTRGTGSGGTAINRDTTTGLWVNTVSMSLIYNTGAGNNTITVAAGQGVYLGSIYIDAAAGQVTCHRSYGQNRKWGIYNAYNQQDIYLKAGDPSGSWIYNTAVTRASNNTPAGYSSTEFNAGSGTACNGLVILDGLAGGSYTLDFIQRLNANNSGNQAFLSMGVGVNSTTAMSGKIGVLSAVGSNAVQNTGDGSARYLMPPSLGINNICALENSPSVISANATYFGSESQMLLSAQWQA